jgi:flagellar biosynthesis anti-sigma factor FlgM
MPDVSSIGNGPVGPANRRAINADTSENAMLKAEQPNTTARDRVELSDHASDLLDRMKDLPGVRVNRVESVKQEIADGEYETEDRLNTAIDRLLADLRD